MTDFLDRLVGEWTYRSASIPDDPDHRREGSETVTLRGAWIVIESDDGARFQLAFDPATGRIGGDFVHWDQPQLWTYDGVADGDRMTLSSRGFSFEVEGQDTDYEDVWEILSPDERRLTGRVLGADGRWRDFLTTTYVRKSAP